MADNKTHTGWCMLCIYRTKHHGHRHRRTHTKDMVFQSKLIKEICASDPILNKSFREVNTSTIQLFKRQKVQSFAEPPSDSLPPTLFSFLNSWTPTLWKTLICVSLLLFMMTVFSKLSGNFDPISGDDYHYDATIITEIQFWEMMITTMMRNVTQF